MQAAVYTMYIHEPTFADREFAAASHAFARDASGTVLHRGVEIRIAEADRNPVAACLTHSVSVAGDTGAGAYFAVLATVPIRTLTCALLGQTFSSVAHSVITTLDILAEVCLAIVPVPTCVALALPLMAFSVVATFDLRTEIVVAALSIVSGVAQTCSI